MPYRRGKRWVAQVRRGGQRIQKVFNRKEDAKGWESSVRGSDWRTLTACSIGEWVNEYLAFSKARFTDKTYREKREVFRRFLKGTDERDPVGSIEPRRVISYFRDQAGVRSGHASNKDRKNLLAAFSWGAKYLGLQGPNPFLTEKFPEERQRRYVPPEAHFWRVYDLAEGQDRVMLLTVLHTAGRRGEVFRLRWEDVDFGNSQIRLWTRKRKDGSMEYDWLPMTDELYASLLAHRQKVQGEWVFLNPKTQKPFVERKRWMRGLCRQAGVRYFGVHAIRHLTASILADAGEPIARIQGILRHRRQATTERYLHRLADLRESIKVLERRGKVVFVGKEKKDAVPEKE